MKTTSYNLRAIAARTLSAVLDQGQSLSSVLPSAAQSLSEKIAPCYRSYASAPYAYCRSWSGSYNS